jgi:glycosyltransferase involved in cell wall biosynthesis
MSNAVSDASRPRVTVVIPTLNEARNLQHLFSRLSGDLHEVIVVDGHSVDDTPATARRLRRDVCYRTVIERLRDGTGGEPIPSPHHVQDGISR